MDDQEYFKKQVRGFLLESNAIEDVWDEQSYIQAKAAWDYLISLNELTPSAILKTHRILMKAKLEYDELGAWRKEAVWIGGREGRPWYAVPDLINNWITQANIHTFDSFNEDPTIDPGLLFEQDHVAFEKIHPFIDGNGRMGRILWNWQRVKAGFDVLIILELQKQEYYQLFK